MSVPGEEETEEWYDPIIEFAVHVFIATMMFLIIGAGATALHVYVTWLES